MLEAVTYNNAKYVLVFNNGKCDIVEPDYADLYCAAGLNTGTNSLKTFYTPDGDIIIADADGNSVGFSELAIEDLSFS